MNRPLSLVVGLAIASIFVPGLLGQDRSVPYDPATEPTVIAVAKVQPAVVNIATERVVRQTVEDPFDAFLNEFFGQPSMGGRQVQRRQQSLGSGFVVDPEGYIITNEHVVGRAADLKIAISFPDGSIYDARYIAGDRQTDLALLKIEKKDGKVFPFIDLKRLSPNHLGETVLALGNPLGYNSSVSRGIISARDREVTVEDVRYKKLLQTDAAINPGNSGGPLIDLAGQLCGVNSVRLAFTPDRNPVQGIGFAISGQVVAEKFAMFRELAARAPALGSRPPVPGAPGGVAPGAPRADAPSATLARKLFGLEFQALTPALASVLGITAESGVLISDVDMAGPAHSAGLKRGLLVYKIGRYEVSNPATIEKLLADVRTGTQVDFVVGAAGRRGSPFGFGGSPQVATVTLVAR
jgi:serine protease Do